MAQRSLGVGVAVPTGLPEDTGPLEGEGAAQRRLGVGVTVPTGLPEDTGPLEGEGAAQPGGGRHLSLR